MGNEKNFENRVKNFLKSENCWFVKFFANAYTKAGIPDILASGNGFFVGIEVKADEGRPSELQLYNVQEIRKSGGFAWIVYPSGFEKLKQKIIDLRQENFCREDEVILK